MLLLPPGLGVYLSAHLEIWFQVCCHQCRYALDMEILALMSFMIGF